MESSRDGEVENGCVPSRVSHGVGMAKDDVGCLPLEDLVRLA